MLQYLILHKKNTVCYIIVYSNLLKTYIICCFGTQNSKPEKCFQKIEKTKNVKYSFYLYFIFLPKLYYKYWTEFNRSLLDLLIKLNKTRSGIQNVFKKKEFPNKVNLCTRRILLPIKPHSIKRAILIGLL